MLNQEGTTNTQEQRKKFHTALQAMNKICEQVNAEESQNENRVIYEVIQMSELVKKGKKDGSCERPTTDNYLNQIADFYNQNWLGNKDYMHIPDYSQVMYNYMRYPIIIAREEGKDEILAISTIKYDENNSDEKDPYFPEIDAKYFSITGILAKRETTHRGMGKKIYEIALRGAYEYNKHYPGTRIMCVIDCRNAQSLRAISAAVERINRDELVGEGQELPANIVGYYELRNSQTGKLEEAPTLVLEVGLNSQHKGIADIQEKTLSYSKSEKTSLFEALNTELREQFAKYGMQKPIQNEDIGTGIVCYYSLEGECSVEKTSIISNGTEKGNDRTPVDDKTKITQGPIIMYFGEEIDGGDDTSER